MWPNLLPRARVLSVQTVQGGALVPGEVLRKVRPEGQAGLVGSGMTVGIASLRGRFFLGEKA